MNKYTEQEVILLVDDSISDTTILESIFSKEGYATHVAADGESAIKKAEEVLPDLILLDIMMPGLNGYETCKHMKSHAKLKFIPIIFLTGKTDPKSILEGFEAGAVDYISKPFNAPELKARVKTHIELKRARDEIYTLRGIIPICTHCKKIRDDDGFWESVETYIQQRTEAMFSHGVCPECDEQLYGDKKWWQKKNAKK